MVLSKEDRVLIEQLHRFKGYGAKKLVKEFPENKWKVCSVRRLLKKLRETGTTSRQAGSGRLNSTQLNSSLIQCWQNAANTSYRQ